MTVKILSCFFVIVVILAAINPCGSVLAVVDLLYFIATPGNVSIVLTWETATEIDNIGFYVQRGITSTGPFTRISPLIISIGDPLTGHLYDYEDTTVEIGVLYFYVLEVLNADGTSNLTIPVGAIIPAPTSTATTTSTQTNTPVITPSPTTTRTPTLTVVPALISSTVMPTFTTSPTFTTTAAYTATPTTTLEPFSSTAINFPVWNPTITRSPESVAIADESPKVTEIEDAIIATNGDQTQLIVIIVILLWFVLALLIIFVVRNLNRENKRNV